MLENVLSQSQSTGQPDLRTLEGAKDFLNYHSPDADAVEKHLTVNVSFQVLLEQVWKVIPDGPGKTVFVRDLNRARMSANSCIANKGA